MPANEKRRYVITSDFQQYIEEYTIANFFMLSNQTLGYIRKCNRITISLG